MFGSNPLGGGSGGYGATGTGGGFTGGYSEVGGGGYGGGMFGGAPPASQTGGLGGYLQQGGPLEPTPGGAAPGQQPQRQTQTLTPVTVRMLQDAVAQAKGQTGAPVGPDAAYCVNGRELGMLMLVACVESAQQQQVYKLLKVNDSTGRISVHIYNDGDTSSTADDIAPGDYVRIYGHLRSWGGQEGVNAHQLMRVESANEIAYHSIEVAHVHLELSGRLVKGAAARPAAAPNGTAAPGQRGLGQQGHAGPAAPLGLGFGGTGSAAVPQQGMGGGFGAAVGGGAALPFGGGAAPAPVSNGLYGGATAAPPGNPQFAGGAAFGGAPAYGGSAPAPGGTAGYSGTAPAQGGALGYGGVAATEVNPYGGSAHPYGGGPAGGAAGYGGTSPAPGGQLGPFGGAGSRNGFGGAGQPF